MNNVILVTYATRYGSTREVAERIATRLREKDLQVDLKSVEHVTSLEGYRAVVLGAPFYVFSLLKDATRFLERFREDLEHLPVALFTLGPIEPTEDLTGARAQIDRALEKIPWFKPVVAEIFVGKYDPKALHLADKLLAAMPASPLHGKPAYDGRDWLAITEWADALPAVLVAE